MIRSIQEEELLLRSETDHFERSFGRFGTFPETELYMQARCAYFHFLQNDLGTEAALLEAIQQGKEILQLWRQDGHGIRVNLTLIYLRLNTYEAMQHCYDHIKWFDTFEDLSSPYDWNDMSLPYLNIVNADMCEEVYPLPAEGGLTNLVALAWIKLRLLFLISVFTVAVHQLIDATVHQSSPLTLLRGNQGVLLTVITFLRPNLPCFANHSLLRLLPNLFAQVHSIIGSVEEHRNKHIWRLLAHPEQAQKAVISGTIQPQGSESEAVRVAGVFMQSVYVNNPETHFIVSLLQAFVRGDYKD